MKNVFQKPTIFLVIGIILMVVGIPSGIYGLTLSGGASLGGVLVLLTVFIGLIFLVLDRILVRVMETKKLNTLEILLLGIGSVVYLYQNRKIEIEQLNPNSEFMIVVENNGKLVNNEYDYKFPFNKVIKTDKNYVVTKSTPRNIDFKKPMNWNNSYYYNIYNYTNYRKVVLYGKVPCNMDRLKVLEYIETNIK